MKGDEKVIVKASDLSGGEVLTTETGCAIIAEVQSYTDKVIVYVIGQHDSIEFTPDESVDLSVIPFEVTLRAEDEYGAVVHYTDKLVGHSINQVHLRALNKHYDECADVVHIEPYWKPPQGVDL